MFYLSTYYRKVAEKATGTGHVTTTTPIPTTIPTNGECCDGAAWVPECGMPGIFLPRLMIQAYKFPKIRHNFMI